MSLAVTGCKTVPEPSPELTPVVMQFDWIFNAQFAGIYQAIEQGYYGDAGIEVQMRAGVTQADTVPSTLAEPLISLGCSELNVLLADVAAGQPAVALGTMFQDSPMGWMYLKDGPVAAFTDLPKVRVGIHPDGARILNELLIAAGEDISNFETFEASYDPGQLFDGSADALQCYYIDEFVKLEQMVGDNAGVFLAKDQGYRAYSQVMFTHRDTIEYHPELVSAFLKATRDGWAYALANPEETVDLIIEKYNPELDRAYQIRSLQKITELMIPEGGYLFEPMDPTVVETVLAGLSESGQIDAEVDMETLLQQQFLPSP